MVMKEIDLLKQKLEYQVMQNDSYEKIYETSVAIDRLLVEYYKKSHKDIPKKDLNY